MKPIGDRVIIERLKTISQVTGAELDDPRQRGKVIAGSLVGKTVYYRNGDWLSEDLYSVDLADVLAEEE